MILSNISLSATSQDFCLFLLEVPIDLYPSKSSLLQPVDTYLLIFVIDFGILIADYFEEEVLILSFPVINEDG